MFREGSSHASSNSPMLLCQGLNGAKREEIRRLAIELRGHASVSKAPSGLGALLLRGRHHIESCPHFEMCTSRPSASPELDPDHGISQPQLYPQAPGSSVPKPGGGGAEAGGNNETALWGLVRLGSRTLPILPCSHLQPKLQTATIPLNCRAKTAIKPLNQAPEKPALHTNMSKPWSEKAS